jgi:hypothetical protein
VQLLKNFPTFYGTRKFHWPYLLPDQSSPHHYLRSILILFTHIFLALPSGLFPSGFPTKIPYAFLFTPVVLHALPTSFSLVSSVQLYLAKSTSYEALRHAVSSKLLSLQYKTTTSIYTAVQHKHSVPTSYRHERRNHIHRLCGF